MTLIGKSRCFYRYVFTADVRWINANWKNGRGTGELVDQAD
jgi:hypothetical protein